MKVTNIELQEDKLPEKIENFFAPAEGNQGICPIKDVMDRFGDKWSIYTLLLLGKEQRVRFNELRSKIHGISQRMLTVTLRSLEQDGLVERTIYAEIPPRVEYNLTPLGKNLVSKLLSMAEWAKEHVVEITKARKQYAVRNKREQIVNN